MALQMHMKIEGVTGEANTYKHSGWSDVISWNWGMTSNRKTVHAGGETKTLMNELSIIKPIGIDSTGIRNLYVLGEIIPRITLNIVPAVGKREAQKNYVDIMMEDVIIKSIVTGGGVDDSFFKEHITLIFDRVTFECNRPAGNGVDDNLNKSAAGNDFRWDVVGNKKWPN